MMEKRGLNSLSMAYSQKAATAKALGLGWIVYLGSLAAASL
jgi:hypothetical protein